MVDKRFAIVLLIVCAGLWSIVFVDKWGGEEFEVAVTYVKADPLNNNIYSPADTVINTKAVIANDDSCININKATATELMVLPGIGPVIAERIIDFRKKNGAFRRLSDVDKVKGIGPAKLRKIESKICF